MKAVVTWETWSAAEARWKAEHPIPDRGRDWREQMLAEISQQLGGAQRPSPPGPSRYLTEDQRVHIADRLREGAGPRAISRELGVAASTVSCEVKRNAHPESGAYRPHAAQRRADARRPRPKPSKPNLPER
jgi:transposase, IS30 family